MTGNNTKFDELLLFPPPSAPLSLSSLEGGRNIVNDMADYLDRNQEVDLIGCGLNDGNCQQNSTWMDFLEQCESKDNQGGICDKKHISINLHHNQLTSLSLLCLHAAKHPSSYLLENLVALNLSSNCFSTCDLPVLT
jgi:hypothetical protein